MKAVVDGALTPLTTLMNITDWSLVRKVSAVHLFVQHLLTGLRAVL